MEHSIIITAGGKGLRMGSDLPKQFINIHNRPILFYTIEQFYLFDPEIEIILVLPKSHIAYWEDLIKQHQFTIKHQVVNGGETRFHSIKNGLNLANGNIIGVHDGVRPFVDLAVIKNTYECAQDKGAAVPALPLKESLREITLTGSISVDRANFLSVQTPQCFQSETIKKAYQQTYRNHFTDDASVVEAMGVKLYTVNGNAENIKITTPIDLKLAELLTDK